jgi:hypothetical protein
MTFRAKSAQLPVDLGDELVDSAGGALEFAGLGADHLHELGHVLGRDLAESLQRLHAPVQVLLGWVAVEILQQSHRQLHSHVVEHLQIPNC